MAQRIDYGTRDCMLCIVQGGHQQQYRDKQVSGHSNGLAFKYRIICGTAQ